MKKIFLTQDKVALVDDDDYERVMCFSWAAERAKSGWYAISSATPWKRLHRFIMEPPDGFVVDHENCDGLDNRRLNLRICTNAENCRNSRPKNAAGSLFKGVYRDPRPLKNRFEAYIKLNYRRIHLGRFETELEAARAYNEAALKYFGAFSRLNPLTL